MWHTEWGYTVSPGRMIRTQQYKYMRYREGNGEELYDLHNDPGEKHNLAGDAEYKGVLDKHRRLLDSHIQETGDPFYSYEVKVDKRWRSHAVGYPNHEGPAAPNYYQGKDYVGNKLQDSTRVKVA
jgi:choline-sulfatase